MTGHIAPNCFERNPVWVPFTHDQALALMGKTKAEQDAARADYAKLAKQIEQNEKGRKAA